MHSDRDAPWWADGAALRHSAAASAEVLLQFPAKIMKRLEAYARSHDLSVQEVIQLAVDYAFQSNQPGRQSR